jgi:hypothetical protein
VRRGMPRYRDPRPGEVAAWLNLHAKELRAMGSPTGKGSELRCRPSPCCGHDKQHNPALQVNDQTGMWRCFRCNTVGNWFTLTRAFGAPLAEQDRYAEDSLHINLSGVPKLKERARRPVTGGHYPDLLAYCQKRGIAPRTLDYWRVSTKGPNALRWPLYAWVGDKWEVVNCRIRIALNKDTAKVHDWFEVKGGPTNLAIGNHLLDLSGDSGKFVMITEGQWDAMVAWQLGFKNVLSIPNGASHIDVQGYLRYIPSDWEVLIAMDMDGPGQTATEAFFAQLGPENLGRVVMPHKDLNDWLLAKPDLCMQDVLDVTKGMGTRAVLEGESQRSGYVGLSLDDAEEAKPEPIAELPWPRSRRILPLYPGQTTGMLAPSGVGKTTWCNQVAVWNAYNYVKVGVISLEGTRDAIKRKIAAPIKGMIPKDKWADTLSNVMLSKLEGTNVTWEQCLSEFERMIAEGARLLILDNLDFITRDDNALKSRAYAKLIDQATRNHVHTIVVWQPNKIDRSKVVNSGSQKGYSQTFQDADNYVNLNLFEDFVRLEIEKAREEGVERLNNKVWLVYNRDTRCFTECEEVHIAPQTANPDVGLPAEQ